MNGPMGRAYGPQLSPLRLPCWLLLALARLVVVAAAIGAALVLLALLAPSPVRGAGLPCWPRPPGRPGGWRLLGAGGPASQVVRRHRRAALAGITRGRHRQQLAGWAEGTPLWGAAARLAWGTSPHHTTPNGPCRDCIGLSGIHLQKFSLR
jgi:hypothetical protein